MTKELEAIYKIDHTICMNFNEGNLRFNIDNINDYVNGEGYNPNDTDCKNINEALDCIECVEKSLKDFEELKKGIAWRKAEYKKELDSGVDCDGIPLSETNRKIVLNLYNIMCALESYYKE